ncbi:DNA repair protein RecO [Candidatus Saccharibacteria bacterium]|nr:DNA repair protein RecO [Candidatus Saccharibacteria bacterium]
MQNNTAKDIRTLGLVLRRTNFGEADRILNLITPVGKISAIAKSVRKPRSKLAGGVEMFTLSDYNIHLGRGELGTVTGAKMVQHFGEIMKDYNRMELAGVMLKKINTVADGVDTTDYYDLLLQGFQGLNEGADVRLVEAWFLMRLARIMGEEVNLYRDIAGESLEAGTRYDFDTTQIAMKQNENGVYGTDEIKLLRLMSSASLKLVRKVRLNNEMVDKAIEFTRMATRT